MCTGPYPCIVSSLQSGVCPSCTGPYPCILSQSSSLCVCPSCTGPYPCIVSSLQSSLIFFDTFKNLRNLSVAFFSLRQQDALSFTCSTNAQPKPSHLHGDGGEQQRVCDSKATAAGWQTREVRAPLPPPARHNSRQTKMHHFRFFARWTKRRRLRVFGVSLSDATLASRHTLGSLFSAIHRRPTAHCVASAIVPSSLCGVYRHHASFGARKPPLSVLPLCIIPLGFPLRLRQSAEFLHSLPLFYTARPTKACRARGLGFGV